MGGGVLGVVTPTDRKCRFTRQIWEFELPTRQLGRLGSRGKDDPNCHSKQAFHLCILRHKTGLCKWNVCLFLQIHSYVIEKCKK